MSMLSSMSSNALRCNQQRAACSAARRSLCTSAAVCKAGLNKYSQIITQPKAQGASQAMLYATEGVDSIEDLAKPMVGVASVW